MTLPATMKGVQLVGHGGPETLVWNEAIPLSPPGPGEVTVRVLAAGVNNTDINTRTGWYAREVTGATAETPDGVEAGGWGGALRFPRIQGGDLCGRVVALGEGVEGLSEGLRVTCAINLAEPEEDARVRFRALGSELDGAFAEYCTVPARHLHDVSGSPLSDVEIAAMPCAYGTALNLLTRAGVSTGEEVLVTGASGGVGLAAVQMAAHLGARVTAKTSPAKAERVLAMGAAQTIGRDEVPEAGRYHAAIDIVGGPGWGALIDALRPGGRYAVSGAIAGPMVEADLRTLYLNDITVFGCTYQPPEVFARLVGFMNAGALHPLISATYPLKDIAAAQEAFATKSSAGKIVLIPPGAEA